MGGSRTRFIGGLAIGLLLGGSAVFVLLQRQGDGGGDAEPNVLSQPQSTQDAFSPRDEGTAGTGESEITDKQRLLVQSRAALRARNAGEAVLDADIPVVAALQEKTVEMRMQAAMEQHGLAYVDEFRRLGLSEDEIDEALMHLANVFEARAIADVMDTQLSNARREYLEYLRDAVGEPFGGLIGPGMAGYEVFESRDAALRQLDELKNAGGNMMLGPDQEARLVELIRETGAITRGTRMAGNMAMDDTLNSKWPRNDIRSYILDQADLQSKSDALLTRMREEQWDPTIQQQVDAFFQSTIAEYDRRIDSLSQTGLEPELVEMISQAAAQIEAIRESRRAQNAGR